MKIGALSDTHWRGEGSGVPRRLKEIFAHVDLILHAGDLVTLSVLAELEAIAPVVAVAGNMDADPVKRALRSRRVIRAGSHRIGLIHGHGVPGRVWLGGGRVDFDVLNAYLLQQFEDVACIVYGHTHLARAERWQGVLLFNPGTAIASWPARRSTVGLLTVDEEGVNGEIMEL